LTWNATISLGAVKEGFVDSSVELSTLVLSTSVYGTGGSHDDLVQLYMSAAAARTIVAPMFLNFILDK
jgi:hypothetical protein